MTKIRLCEFNLYWKLMCTYGKNDRIKKTSSSPPTPVTVFFISEKLIRKPTTLKCSDFQFVSVNYFVKN